MDRNLVRVGDLEMSYSLMGEGPAIVLIMGLTATADWWDPAFLQALVDSGYRVLVFDNRGSGATSGPPGDLTVPGMADDTAGLMEALGIEKAHVLGMSMGGMIAQELILRHPDRVDRLVLCVTFCSGRECVRPEREVLRQMADRTGTPEELVARYCRLMFTADWLNERSEHVEDFMNRAMIAPMSDEDAGRQFMATVNFSACSRLPQVVAPTLVACGTDDVMIPAENSRMIAGLIPGARLVEFEGAGHAFMYERREEFLEVLLDFLS